MNQAALSLQLSVNKTRKKVCLEQMKAVVPLSELIERIVRYFFEGSAVRTIADNVHDVTEGNSLLHGEETVAYGDAGYQGFEQRPDAKEGFTWNIAMRSGKRKLLNKDDPADALIDKAEKRKAGMRAKMKHPFRVIKRQFGFVKVRYRGLKRHTAQLFNLFTLSNL